MHTTALSYGTYLPVRCVLSANASRSHGFATPHNTKLNSKILGARYIHSISSLSSLRKIRHVLISASSKDLPDTDNNDNDDDNEDFLPEDFALDEEFDGTMLYQPYLPLSSYPSKTNPHVCCITTHIVYINTNIQRKPRHCSQEDPPCPSTILS